MKKRIFIIPVLIVSLVFFLTGCSGSVNYNTVEGSRYDETEFSAANIVTMSQILEDNILESWYEAGVTPDNFTERMEDQLDDTVISVYSTGYRSWYSAIDEIGYRSPETLSQDITVGNSRYYINSDGELIVETTLKGTGEKAHEATLTYSVDRNKVPTSIAVNVQRSLGEKMANAGLNTLLGMGMAFFVLIIISLVISLLAVLSGSGRKKKEHGKTGTEPVKEKSKEASMDAAVSQIAEREEGLKETEIAAVIAAAVAAFEADTGVPGTVTSVSRQGGAFTESALPQMPDTVPEDGVFVRPIRKRNKINWKKAI